MSEWVLLAVHRKSVHQRSIHPFLAPQHARLPEAFLKARTDLIDTSILTISLVSGFVVASLGVQVDQVESSTRKSPSPSQPLLSLAPCKLANAPPGSNPLFTADLRASCQESYHSIKPSPATPPHCVEPTQPRPTPTHLYRVDDRTAPRERRLSLQCDLSS